MEITNTEQLGRMICTLRNRSGMTLRQLADDSGVSFNTIYNTENNRANISADNLLKLLRSLGACLCIENVP